MSAEPTPTRPMFLPITRASRLGLFALLLAALAFGAITLQRSAFSDRRRTDADVFFRAAWAIRTDRDIYQVHDTNGWHYHYPATLAVVMQPLAQPPPPPPAGKSWPVWADRSGIPPPLTPPYPLAVAIWYVVTLAALAAGAHWSARAVEWSSPDPVIRHTPAYSRRWWALRALPVLVVLPAIGATLGRGQVNTILLMLLAGMLLCAARGRSFWAGVWLAGAITLKFFPAFLLLYPLWRRDGRWLAGALAGLLVFAVAVPALVIGLPKTLDYHRKWYNVLVAPALGLSSDTTRDAELLGMRKDDNQSPLAVLYHNAWAGTPKDDRPPSPAPWMKATHLLIGAGLVGATMFAGGLRRREARSSTPLLLGLLIAVNLPLLPTSESHYFVLHLPLVAHLMHLGMLATDSQRLPRAQWWGWGAYLAGMILPKLPYLGDLKWMGMSMITGMVLWMVGARVLLRQRRAEVGAARHREPAERL